MMIILDPGHGGIDANGNYTTAPKKMHRLSDGTFMYEGFINRLISVEIAMLLESKGINYIYTVEPTDATDISLKKRVEIERSVTEDSIFLSIHSNASKNHNASGLELFTNVGETDSDKVATEIMDQWELDFEKIKIRKDTSDGDPDKETNFYVLKNTKGKAVLLEILFFDNEKDAQLLQDKCFRKKIAESTVNGIINFLNQYK